MVRAASLSRRWPRGLLHLGWLVVVIAFATGATALRRADLAAGLQTEARALQRLVSQRADQHDAQLTALAALAAGMPAAREPLERVAEGFLQFYPRLRAIDVIGTGPATSFTTRAQCPAACAEALARASAVAVDATPRPVAAGDGRYLLAKRVGQGAATQYLVLEVDAARLLERADESRRALPGDSITLLLPDGTVLIPAPAAPDAIVLLVEEATLTSASQPLRLRLERRPALAALVPWDVIAVFGLALAALLMLGTALVRTRRAARDAARRAALGEHAARLAHAGRVNALGEMASGIAHEINQPLTALLSQSQAALRLFRRDGKGDRERLEKALEANVKAARRAGAILSRLRGWASKDLPPPQPLDLNAVARAAADLDRAEAAAAGIALDLDLAEPPPIAMAEPVQAEQVVHNLLRNAREAMDGAAAGTARRITLRTRTLADGAAEIAVEDNGPGIPPDLRDRLFEPFFTTKSAGMGLGLSLCRTMVEQVQGRIAAEESPGGGARFTVRLPGVQPA